MSIAANPENQDQHTAFSVCFGVLLSFNLSQNSKKMMALHWRNTWRNWIFPNNLRNYSSLFIFDGPTHFFFTFFLSFLKTFVRLFCCCSSWSFWRLSVPIWAKNRIIMIHFSCFSTNQWAADDYHIKRIKMIYFAAQSEPFPAHFELVVWSVQSESYSKRAQEQLETISPN